jgi:hypothetical protein
MEATLHDIVHFLTIARTHSDLISERHPEYAVPLKRFQDEVQRIQSELIKRVRPGLLSDED